MEVITTKKLTSLFLAFLMICSLGVSASAASGESPTEVVLWPSIMPLTDLYDESSVVSTTGSFTSDTFATSSINTNGKIIRFWYENDSSLNATVTLYKKGLINYKAVATMTVEAGKNLWEEYTNSSTDTYYVKVDAVGGNSVKGYLRVVQTNTSLYD